VNGIVGTIQWEGFREGVDDVRYLTTLEKAISGAMHNDPKLAWQAQTWIENTNLSAGDLDQIRSHIAGWIVKLQASGG
jgi:hypothetical protein